MFCPFRRLKQTAVGQDPTRCFGLVCCAVAGRGTGWQAASGTHGAEHSPFCGIREKKFRKTNEQDAKTMEIVEKQLSWGRERREQCANASANSARTVRER